MITGKVKEWAAADFEDVIYVPDNAEDASDSVRKVDFVVLCNGDVEKAKMLFSRCDWEHPATILDQDGEEAGLGLTDRRGNILPDDLLGRILTTYVRGHGMTEQDAVNRVRLNDDDDMGNLVHPDGEYVG